MFHLHLYLVLPFVVSGFALAGGDEPTDPPAFGGHPVVSFEAIGSPVDGKVIDLALSPDATRLAFIVRHDDGDTVVLDGEAMRDFDRVDTLLFSPDSRHLAFTALIGERWHVVYDGAVGPGFERFDGFGLERNAPAFSDDGARVAYRACNRGGREWSLMALGSDGSSELLFTNAKSHAPRNNAPAFSGDFRHRVRVVRSEEAKKSYRDPTLLVVEVDGEPGEAWRNVFSGNRSIRTPVQVSRQGFHYAYVGSTPGRKEQYFVIVDDTRIGPFDKTPSMVTLSPDGGHYFFVARWEEEISLVWDGEEHGPFVCEPERVVLSPDGAHFAFVGKNRDDRTGQTTYLVVRDGARSGPFESVGPIVFSPDSKRCAFAAAPRDARGSMVMVLDGSASARYDDVASPLFSPDSKRFAFVARKNRTSIPVVDGEARAGEKNIVNFGGRTRDRRLVFSADSRRLAYRAEGDGGREIVIDGTTRLPSCSDGGFRFTADGRHIVEVGYGRFGLDGRGRDLDRLEWPLPRDGEPHAGLLVDREDGSLAFFCLELTSRGDRSFYRAAVRIASGEERDETVAGATDRKPPVPEIPDLPTPEFPVPFDEATVLALQISAIEKQLAKKDNAAARPYLEAALEKLRAKLARLEEKK